MYSDVENPGILQYKFCAVPPVGLRSIEFISVIAHEARLTELY